MAMGKADSGDDIGGVSGGAWRKIKEGKGKGHVESKGRKHT